MAKKKQTAWAALGFATKAQMVEDNKLATKMGKDIAKAHKFIASVGGYVDACSVIEFLETEYQSKPRKKKKTAKSK